MAYYYFGVQIRGYKYVNTLVFLEGGSRICHHCMLCSKVCLAMSLGAICQLQSMACEHDLINIQDSHPGSAALLHGLAHTQACFLTTPRAHFAASTSWHRTGGLHIRSHITARAIMTGPDASMLLHPTSSYSNSSCISTSSRTLIAQWPYKSYAII